jgi:hypothetical protein
MNKRFLIVLVLVAVLPLLGGAAPTLADSPRVIQGQTGIQGPWAGGMDIFIDFDVREVNPHTHRAWGPVSWKIWHKEWGWREVKARAACVFFGEEMGNAILVSRIVHKTGWGQGEPGEFAYWWLTDSEGGDLHRINYYRLDDPDTPEDEWYEFFPRGRPPDCEFFTPTEPPIGIAMGDLAIQQ